ncbi:hypothetical protein [uncultured Victivallis sp.]|uniref:hypothetical protein n=1 Tax=uncultured Victivallis sp. TaxID=354118 RepID=UPI0025E304CD|nr:hypothetical protein [uncultured Victivallis sp.]
MFTKISLIFSTVLSTLILSGTDYTYSYPNQYSSGEAKRTDPGNTVLTDDNAETFVCSAGAIDEFFIDIRRSDQTPVRGVQLSIPQQDFPAGTKSFYPWDLRIYLPDAKGNFPSTPDYIFTVPYEKSQLSTVSIELPRTLTVQNFRLGLVPVHSRVAIADLKLLAGEVSHPTSICFAGNATGEEIQAVPLSDEENQAISFQPSSETGVVLHTLHTDYFYPNNKRNRPSWNIEMILPTLRDANFGIVRDSLYSAFFVGGPETLNELSVKQNRERVEHTFSLYQKSGIKVIICAMYSYRTREAIDEFNSWLIELGKKFPCLTAIEIDNEPNAHKSPESYATLVKEAAPALQASLPHVKILVGTCAGYGAYLGNQKQLNPDQKGAFAWLEAALKLGILEYADGVSFHPYAYGPPECGRDEIASSMPRNGLHQQLTQFRNMVESFSPQGKKLEYYITEYGYSTRGKFVSKFSQNTEQNRLRLADWLGRNAFLLADEIVNGFPLKAYCVYSLKCDPVWANEANFGLVSENLLQRFPSYFVMQKMATRYGNVADNFAPERKLKPVFTVNPDAVHSTTWRRRKDNALVIGFWRMEQYQQFDQDFTSLLKLHLPSDEIVDSVTLDNFAENTPRRLGFTQEGDLLTLPVQIMRNVSTVTITFGGKKRRQPVQFSPTTIRWTRSTNLKQAVKIGKSIRFTTEPGKWSWIYLYTDSKAIRHTPGSTGILLELENRIPSGLLPIMFASYADGTADRVDLSPKGFQSQGVNRYKINWNEFKNIQNGKRNLQEIMELKVGYHGQTDQETSGDFRIREFKLVK